MARKLAAARKNQGVRIPADQWDLPVAFDAFGNSMTLRQVMAAGSGAVSSLASLSAQKRAELTVERIRAQPKFEVAMIGGGIVDKERAIKEVEAQTDVGKALTEIEQILIQNLLAEAKNQ